MAVLNVLHKAIPLVSRLIPNTSVMITATITIKNRDEGLPRIESIDSLSIYAHVQPVTPAELKKFSISTVDSTRCYKLYISRQQVTVLSSFMKKKADFTVSFKDPVDGNNYDHKLINSNNWHDNGWLRMVVARC